jgi:hypothetical protein
MYEYVSCFLESSLASFCFGALVEFTVSLMGESFLCIFVMPLIVGGEGLRLMYFNLSSLWIINLNSFTLFLRSFEDFLVRSPVVVVKLLLAIEFLIFSWYLT